MSEGLPQSSSSTAGSSLLDEYAMAIMNGFCSNPALSGEVSEDELVGKAFEMAQQAMRLRLGYSEEFLTDIFFLMDGGRYVAAISRPSKTVAYTRSEREAIVYFDDAKAADDATFCNGINHNADVMRGQALVTANGKITPQPVTDWKEQMTALGKTPPPEPGQGA